ncbi:hypothetical protein [Psychromonas sp. MME2]|uniref:4'-phosphopantetheinyl transferase family protein n=1 Tax=Psychromonas sp. MME2 TaxID=3231033 RepID=UPI00339D1B62
MDINHPSLLTLPNHSIHLWHINPQQIKDANQINYLQTLLSSDEQARVARYRTPEAQHSALITRAFLRLILSQYVAIQPQDWQFTVSAHGKPEIANSTLPLRFNLSHNSELIICSICLNHDIGCDIENVHRKINYTGISKRYFTERNNGI